MRKRILSLLCVLALCLGLLPVTALAAAPIGQVLYVGGVQISSTGYWTTDSAGNVTGSTAGETPTDNYIHYDAEDNVLTLHNATIKKELNSSASISGSTYISGSAIGVFNRSGNAELTINLVGTNTIADVSGGIYVLANSNGGATLTITGNGSLTTEGNGLGSLSGISVISFAGNANLTINNVDVTATNSYAQGIRLQPSESASATLAVNGGSLTASGSKGIDYQFGAGETGSGTPSLTVSGNAIVRVNGGIINRSTTDLQIGAGSSGSNGGIVFDGSTGTVYGSVTLQDNLEIKSGETLTIGDGASLTVPSGKTLTNNGTVTTTGSGTLTNNGTINNSGTLPETISGNQPPKITTASLPDGTVDTAYNETLHADNTPTQWSVTSGSLPAGLTLDTSTGVISGATTAADTYNFTVTATNDNGSDSKAFTLTVTANTEPTSYTISTADQLRNFAEAVNTGNVTANAVLTADITLTDANWTPIGKDDDNMYNGTFDGQGHTISGLQCSVTSGNVAGLFGVIGSSGVVKNVGIADSNVSVVVTVTDKFAYAGGVCGYSEGTVENCWNSGSVTATNSSESETNAAYAGGVCGYSEGTVENCWNSGSVTANSSDNGAYAGGVCGRNFGSAVIRNCWNSGSVSGSSSICGGVCGGADNTSNITNCYWLAGTADYGIGNPGGNTNAESKTTDKFSSGEVAWLLNEPQAEKPWGQGSNNMPVLKDNHPESVTSYVPVRITIVMTDTTQKSYYSAKGSTFTEYPTGYAYFFKENETHTWINKGTQTYDADATIYAVNMTLEKIPAKAATCTENGHIAYWYCAAFDKYFSDANGVNEITYESTVIQATGHQLTKVAAKEPTSTQAGNIEYWVCNTCGKYFSDANGVKEITYESTVIPATGHNSGGSPTYAITVKDADNGTVTCYAHGAEQGAVVTFQAKPHVGYVLDKLTVTDAGGKTVAVEKGNNTTYTFVMPGSKVTVEAVFTPTTSGLPFTDVGTGDWFYSAVKFVYENGLMDGVGNNLFAPNATLNRAMAVTILYRLEGSPDLDEENLGYPFADVDGDTWYSDAVYWARLNGIVDGVENNHFDPTGSLTREQMATILYRYAQYKGADVSAAGDLSGFADSANVSSWAADAVKWAVGTGLVNGVEGNALAPQGTSTRAQTATVLARFCGSVI